MSTYVIVHDDDFPFALKDFQIDFDRKNKSVYELMEDIADVLNYVKQAEKEPEETVYKIYKDVE